MQLQITIEVWDKGKWFVATCPELDVMAQGPTREQARFNLLEVIKIQFQEMTANHALVDYLSECGYVPQNHCTLPVLKWQVATTSSFVTTA